MHLPARVLVRRRPAFVLLLALALTMAVIQPARALDLAGYRGKVVYLDFWASWCGPCVQSFPWMNRLHESLRAQGLQVIAVNLDRDRQAAERFLARHPATFDVQFDPTGTLAREHDVQGMPNAFLFDRAGRLIHTHIGFTPADAPALEALVKEALSQ